MKSGTILKNNWIVNEKIGEGAFAKVYSVSPTASNTGVDNSLKYVAKVIPLPTGKGKVLKEQTVAVNSLYYEYSLHVGHFKHFQYAALFPPKHYGDEIPKSNPNIPGNGIRYLVMQQLEHDLTSFCNTFTVKTKSSNKSASKSVPFNVISSIGFQLFHGLELMHNQGFVFVDVKPDNFMVTSGRNPHVSLPIAAESQNRLYFIDFGMVERYTALTAGKQHRENTTKSKIPGTPAFVSLDVGNGSTPSRKDDLEAAALVLLSMPTCCQLPWSSAPSEKMCLEMKNNCNITEYAASVGLPFIGDLIMYCRSLEYDEAPNYEHCKQLILKTTDGVATDKSIKNNRARNVKATRQPKKASSSIVTPKTCMSSPPSISMTKKRSTPTKRSPKASEKRSDNEEEMPLVIDLTCKSSKSTKNTRRYSVEPPFTL